MSRYLPTGPIGQERPEGDAYPPSRRAALSEAEFEVFIAGTLTMWVSSLFLILLKSEHVLTLGPSDLGTTASVAATLASLALALLGIVHQLNLANALLKLGLAFLTLVFLLSTFLVTGAYARYVEQFSCDPAVTLWVVSLAALTLVPMLVRRLLLLGRKAGEPTASPSKGRTWIRDLGYVLPLLIPVPLFASVQGGCRLLAYSVLLLVLGLAGVMLLLLLFVLKAYLKPSEPLDEMKGLLKSIFARARERDYDGTRPAEADDDKLLIPLSDLWEEPELFHASRSLVERTLMELVDTSHIYRDVATGAYYKSPDAEEVKRILTYVESHQVVVFKQKGEGAVLFMNSRLAKELGRKYEYPPSVIAAFLEGRIVKILEREYFCNPTPNGWQMYVKKGDVPRANVLALWESWMSLNERRAEENGIALPTAEGGDLEAESEFDFLPTPPRDVRLMQEVTKTVPVKGHELFSDKSVRGFFSSNILPKKLIESLETSDGAIYDFFEALERQVRTLRTAAPASSSTEALEG